MLLLATGTWVCPTVIEEVVDVDAVEKVVKQHLNERIEWWLYHMYATHTAQVRDGRMMLVERSGRQTFDGFILRSIELPFWHGDYDHLHHFCPVEDCDIESLRRESLDQQACDKRLQGVEGVL